MFPIRRWSDIKEDTGVNGPDQLSSRSPLYPISVSTTGLATGLQETPSAKVPTGIVFAGFMITGVCILNASTGGAVDGAALAVEGGPTIASNTMYSAALVTVQFATSQSVLNNTPIPFPAMVGDAKAPFILPCPFYINGGEDFRVTIANNSGVTIDANVVLWGRRISVS